MKTDRELNKNFDRDTKLIEMIGFLQKENNLTGKITELTQRAIFFYAKNYYNSQNDLLYQILCKLNKSLKKPQGKIEEEERQTKKFYKQLVKKYQNENIFINGDIITVSELDEYFPEEEGYSIHFEEFEIDEYNKFVNPEVHREYKFDSFFLIFKDCELEYVFGMINVVPWNEKEIQYIAD